MTRTVDTEAHAVRREAFVDAAQRLMQAKGYEQMSVQDVLDELGASRGAFYHYFDSKTALLEAVVTRTVDTALASVIPVGRGPVGRRRRQARGPLRRHRPVEDAAHGADAGADARLALGREHPHARQDCGST